MNSSRFSFAPPVFWLLFVTFLLLLPGSELPRVTWLSKIWLDKWVHIGLFLVLVFLWCRIFTSKKASIRISMLAMIYGIVLELVQHCFIPYRSFEAGDIIADGIGCASGYFIAVRYSLKK